MIERRSVEQISGDMRYAPLFYYLQKRSNPELRVPPEHHKSFSKLRRIIAARNIFLSNQLRKVLQSFKKDGVEVILLKGVMMQNIYPSGLRPFSDMDVLIKKDALTRVKEIFDGLGYRTSPKFHSRIEDFDCELNYVKADVLSVMIEPHWLLDPPYPYGKKICMEKLWRRSQPVDFLGLKSRVLAPQDSLLHFCLHFFKHYHQGCHSSCDMAEIIYHYGEKMNWDRFLSDVFEAGLVLPVRFSLEEAARLFNPPLPDPVLKKLHAYKPERMERWVFNRLSQRRKKDHYPVPAVVGFLTMPLALKLPYGWKKLFPDKNFMKRRYPELKSQPLFICYLYRVFNLAFKTVKILPRFS